MRRRLDDVRKAREVALFRQQRELARQQNDEGDLHDLGRLNGDGKIRQNADAEPLADVVHAEPGAVAVARQAERRAQQQDKSEIKGQQPLPLFAQLPHINGGKEKIKQHTDHQAESLNGDIFQRAAKVRGACDKHHPVERRGHAQSEQHQV